MDKNMEILDSRKTKFIENRIIDLHKNLIIDENIEIVGNNLSIKDEIIVNCTCSFENVTFQGSTIHIKNNAHVEFSNCKFYSRNDLSRIILYPNSKTSISICDCSFNNYYKTIEVNDNIINGIENTYFIGCSLAISIESEKGILDVDTIKNNVMVGEKGCIFLDFNSFKKIDFVNQINLLRSLSVGNNGVRIIGLRENKIIIDTEHYYIKNDDELKKTLENCSDGAVICLTNYVYRGDISVNKSVLLIGEEGTRIRPVKGEINKSGITVNAGNVVLENLDIGSDLESYFRDGINFTSMGGENCILKRIVIEGVRRRGISLWGENTNNTYVEECTFNNISSGSAISLKGKTTIYDCKFNMCENAIIKKYDEEVTIKNCGFNKIEKLILAKRELLNTMILKNNIYNWINIFLCEL